MVAKKEVIEAVKSAPEIVKNIIDMDLSLNTMQSGKAEFITNKINGVLKALIVETDTNIQIRITLSEHDSIVLFEDVSFYGTQYLPISAEKILKRNEKLLYSSTDWILNDKLRIVVKGPFNSTVKIKVRYM